MVPIKTLAATSKQNVWVVKLQERSLVAWVSFDLFFVFFLVFGFFRGVVHPLQPPPLLLNVPQQIIDILNSNMKKFSTFIMYSTNGNIETKYLFLC